MDFWHEVTLIPAVVVVDGLGTPQHTPGLDGPDVAAVLEQAGSGSTTSSTELTGQQVVTNWTMLLDISGVAIDAFGYVRFRGELYEVDGEPATIEGPDGPHHIEARLRKVR